MENFSRKSVDIKTVEAAIKILVKYHNKKYHELERRHKDLHDLVIVYYNSVLNTEYYEEFYTLVQKIFEPITVVKKHTIGEFYHSCALAMDNSNSYECYDACKNSLRPPLNWHNIKCACTIINYTDDKNFKVFTGMDNERVLIHVDNPLKTKFSKKEINNFINQGHKTITIVRNVNGGHVDAGTFQLDGSAIHFSQYDESPSTALFIFAFIFVLFLVFLYVTKPRHR